MSYPSLTDRGIDRRWVYESFVKETENVVDPSIIIDSATALAILDWLEETCPQKNDGWKAPIILGIAISRGAVFAPDLGDESAELDEYLKSANSLRVAISEVNSELKAKGIKARFHNHMEGDSLVNALPTYRLVPSK